MATVALILAACTTRPLVVDGPVRGPVAARAGVVVAARGAATDRGAGEIAAEIARRTGFGLVVSDSDGARSVDEAYERRVREAAQGPLQLYVEIQGNDRRDAADRIEIATVGVDAEQAVKLRTLLELVRDAHLRARPAGMRLEVRVRPADPVVQAASGAGRAGNSRPSSRALHIELPRVARQEGRQLYALILTDFLREAIALPSPAQR